MIDAILKSLPALISLIHTFMAWSIERGKIEQGRLVAIAEAAQSLNKTLAKAAAAEQEADEAHAKDATDGAFDKEFRRD